MKAKISISPLRRFFPLPRSAIREHPLQALNHSTGRSLSEGGHRATIGQRVPGLLADNAVGYQPGSFLERVNRCFQLLAKYAIDIDLKVIRRSARCKRRTTSPVAPRPIVG